MRTGIYAIITVSLGLLKVWSEEPRRDAELKPVDLEPCYVKTTEGMQKLGLPERLDLCRDFYQQIDGYYGRFLERVQTGNFFDADFAFLSLLAAKSPERGNPHINHIVSQGVHLEKDSRIDALLPVVATLASATPKAYHAQHGMPVGYNWANRVLALQILAARNYDGWVEIALQMLADVRNPDDKTFPSLTPNQVEDAVERTLKVHGYDVPANK